MKTKHLHLLVYGAVLYGSNGKTNGSERKKLSIAKIGLLLFAYLLVCTATVSAQGPQLEWAKAMSGNVWDNGYAITVDNQGNSYTTGLYRGDTLDCDPGPGVFNLTPANSSGNNLFISKLDATGNFIWAKKFASPRSNYSFSIAHDAADNIYVTGYFYDSLDFDPGPNDFVLHATGPQSATTSDVFIVKLDSAGNFLWAKTLGGTSNDMAYSLAIDSLNEVYVTGKFIGTVDFDPGPNTFNITPPTNGSNAFVLKLDSAGHFIWAKSMGAPASAGTGSNGIGYAVTVDAGGNLYSTGYFSGTVNFDPNGGQTNLTANGTTINYDIYILKLDASGNLAWAKSIGSPKLDQGTGISLDPTDNVYITGTFNDVADFDPGVGTYNMTASAAQNSDMFVLKLDNDGNFLWARDIGGSVGSNFSNNTPYSIITDKAGNSYTAGTFYGFITCDPSSATPGTYLNSFGIADIFILKLAPSGTFKWLKQMGGTNIDVVHSLTMDASSNIYATGWFQGTSNFNPNATTGGTLTSVTSNSADAIVIKLNCGDTTSYSITDTADCNGYTLNDTTYLNSGTYIQKMPNVQGCDSTITLHLTIIPVMDMNINITASGDTLGTVDHYETYQWLFNGLVIPGATDSTLTAAQNGNYQVAVTNERGCHDTSQVYSVTDITGVGNTSVTASNIKVYPNPTEDMINIQSPVTINVSVTGIEGRLLQKIENARSFSIKSLAKGVYLLRITDKNDALIQTVKIVKQ